MSATLTVDPRKYSRLANRIVVKAIETEDEYDHMVAAVEQLIHKGEDRLSPEESALLETMAILVQAYDDRHHPLPAVAPNVMLAYLMETSGRSLMAGIPNLSVTRCAARSADEPRLPDGSVCVVRLLDPRKIARFSSGIQRNRSRLSP